MCECTCVSVCKCLLAVMHGLTYISCMRTLDVVWTTWQEWWMIRTGGERERERVKNICAVSLIWWYIYIYIVFHRQICFVLSELFSVARHTSFPELGPKPDWVKHQSKPLTIQARGAISYELNFKRLWITITIVYIHPFNGYRDLIYIYIYIYYNSVRFH